VVVVVAPVAGGVITVASILSHPMKDTSQISKEIHF